MIEMKVAIVPIGKTTPREIAALRSEVQDAMRNLRGVGRTAPVRCQAPEGAKGVAEEIGAFLVGVPPDIVSVVFNTIKSVLLRPAQPPAEVEITARSVKLKFDPRRVSLDDMASFVERVRPKAEPAS